MQHSGGGASQCRRIGIGRDLAFGPGALDSLLERFVDVAENAGKFLADDGITDGFRRGGADHETAALSPVAG